MKKFGPDFFNITELLTEEELLIQETANNFRAKRIYAADK